MKYVTYPVSPLLKNEICCYWSLEIDKTETELTERVYSTGNPQLLFHYGPPFIQQSQGDILIQPPALFSGQYSNHYDVTALPGSGMFGIVFHPFGLRRFIDFPMALAYDSVLNFSDIFPQHKYICPIIIEAENNIQRRDIFEAFLLKIRIPHPSKNYLLSQYAINTIAANIDCPQEIPPLHQLELSGRQIERMFRDYVGISPRFFTKLLRVKHAASLLESSYKLTDIAYECGYFDQPHFIKTFKSITGYTPGEYRKQIEQSLPLAVC